MVPGRIGTVNQSAATRSDESWSVMSFFHTILAEMISVAKLELLTVVFREAGLDPAHRTLVFEETEPEPDGLEFSVVKLVLSVEAVIAGLSGWSSFDLDAVRLQINYFRQDQSTDYYVR